MKRIVLILVVLFCVSIQQDEQFLVRQFCVKDTHCLAPKLKSVQKENNDFVAHGSDVVIIGMGRWGRILRSELKKQPLARGVFAVARSNYSELLETDEFNEENLFSYSSENFDALLSNQAIGAVVVATSYPTHYEHARRALRAGKDVMIEKPAVETAAQLRELSDIARRHGRTLTVGYEYLYDPNVGQLAREISKGLVGQVNSIEINMLNPRGRFDPTANVVEDLCAHPLSMLHLLAGVSDFEIISCRLMGEAAEIDLVYGTVPVRINLSRDAAERKRTIVVSGAKRSAELDYFSGKLSLSALRRGVAVEIEKGDARFPSAFKDGPIAGPSTLAAEFNEFLSAVNFGTLPRNCVEHVFWITPCLEQIYSKLETAANLPDKDVVTAS